MHFHFCIAKTTLLFGLRNHAAVECFVFKCKGTDCETVLITLPYQSHNISLPYEDMKNETYFFVLLSFFTFKSISFEKENFKYILKSVPEYYTQQTPTPPFI